MTLHAIILAGGSGTRFWPLSRERLPKQLLRIGSEDILMQQTVARVAPLVDRSRTFVVTHEGLADDIARQLTARFGGSWDRNFIIAPAARNTAPALGLAALHVASLDPDGIMVVLSADHAIRKADAFLEVLRNATAAARSGQLVTLGITPTRPETGYGYIELGSPLSESATEHVFRVAAFVEKPDLETAKKYVASGRFLWNSGIFVWKAAAFLEELAALQPALYRGLVEIQQRLGTADEAATAKAVFAALDSISVDYAVMEKTSRAAVIPADIGWSDVGSWTALDEVTERDGSGNIIAGNVIDHDSVNSIVYAEKRLVATIGLKDVIVVDTPDATLVCSKEHAQDVKKVVEELRRRNSDEHVIHRTVHRPWGSYTVLEEGDGFKIKRIVVQPGARLSYQMHHHRNEHWVVVAGTARVTNGDHVQDLHMGQSTYISATTGHRLENPGRIPLQIIEVQNGEYLGEDDIVRLEDDYNRHETNCRGILPVREKHRAEEFSGKGTLNP